MAYNSFIAYDWDKLGQIYDGVRDRIRELGPHWQLQYSLFYVHSNSTPQQAYAYVASAIDGNDRLAVINAADWLGAMISNWDHPPIDAINASGPRHKEKRALVDGGRRPFILWPSFSWPIFSSPLRAACAACSACAAGFRRVSYPRQT